jgi:hypothetical protein
METKLEVARNAALLLHPDAVDVKFVKTLKTGEDEFTGSRKGKAGHLTITLNPNGTKATVEWKGRLSTYGHDYRVFRVEGVPTTDDVPVPVAASAR